MQWALSSENIDMAIICKEAARNFVKYDDKFEVISPVVKNSDIFLLKDKNPKTIGVTQNRNYQINLVNKYFNNSKVLPLINSALIYGLESGTIDGVVIDSIKSLSLKGKKEPTTISGEYDTYVLLVNKDFKNKKIYDSFIKLYNECVVELENINNLKCELERYTDKTLTSKDMGEIIRWKLKFLQIDQKK